MDVHVLLALFHIFLVAPLFLFVAISRSNSPELLYKFLMGLGVFLFIYHGYKAFFKYMKSSSSLWVNLIHILFVAPLLFYVGYNGKDTPRPAYEIMALTGFAALGYHLYSLVISVNLIKIESNE